MSRMLCSLLFGLALLPGTAAFADTTPTTPTTRPTTQPATRPAGGEARDKSQDEAQDDEAPAEERSGAADRLAAVLERLRGGSDKGADKEAAEVPDEEAGDTAEPAPEPGDAVKEVEVSADETRARLTPAELMRQIRQKKEEERQRPLVAQIDFSAPLSERPMGFNLFGGQGVDLRGVLERLDAVADDPDCPAVLLTFYNGGMMNFAQAEEIRGKLNALRRAGKRTFVYADTYDTISYLVASAATDVVLMDGGELFIPGVAVEPTFYRGALNLLGVQPDFVQIGEYKGAEEPYTRSEPSPELADEMEKLVDSLYDHIVDEISAGRAIPRSRVKQVIDRAMLPARQARQMGFVDHLADADGLRDLFNEELGGDPRIDPSYGHEEEAEPDVENPLALLAAMKPKSVDATKPSIALIYAEGAITGGEGGGGMFGSGAGVGSEAIRRAMRLAERDDEIKAIVIRIDSPGGSALAAEAMYQAVRRVAEKKPVVVSIGNMAASGGYYLACAGDTIYADESAIIGSIGVVGGKLVLNGLYDKVGINTTMFSRGKNAGLFSQTQPWDDRQQRLVRNWMKSTYDQFTDRVMETRGDDIGDIDDVARGRIFLAKDARKLGMIDELGGLHDAMAAAAEQGGLGEEYDIVVLPNQAGGNPFAGLPIGEAPAEEALKLLPTTVRDAVLDALSISELLAERPVILMSPVRVRVR